MEIAASIKKLQPKVSNRKIAKALGTTINRDVGPNGPDQENKARKNNAGKQAGGPNGPPALTGAAAVAAVEKKEMKESSKAAKDEQREEDARRILSLAQVTGKFPTLVIDPPWANLPHWEVCRRIDP